MIQRVQADFHFLQLELIPFRFASCSKAAPSILEHVENDVCEALNANSPPVPSSHHLLVCKAEATPQLQLTQSTPQSTFVTNPPGWQTSQARARHVKFWGARGRMKLSHLVENFLVSSRMNPCVSGSSTLIHLHDGVLTSCEIGGSLKWSVVPLHLERSSKECFNTDARVS